MRRRVHVDAIAATAAADAADTAGDAAAGADVVADVGAGAAGAKPMALRSLMLAYDDEDEEDEEDEAGEADKHATGGDRTRDNVESEDATSSATTPSATTSTTTTAAPSLPAPWHSAVEASTGKTYYYNAETGESAWTAPTASSCASTQRSARFVDLARRLDRLLRDATAAADVNPDPLSPNDLEHSLSLAYHASSNAAPLSLALVSLVIETLVRWRDHLADDATTTSAASTASIDRSDIDANLGNLSTRLDTIEVDVASHAPASPKVDLPAAATADDDDDAMDTSPDTVVPTAAPPARPLDAAQVRKPPGIHGTKRPASQALAQAPPSTTTKTTTTKRSNLGVAASLVSRWNAVRAEAREEEQRATINASELDAASLEKQRETEIERWHASQLRRTGVTVGVSSTSGSNSIESVGASGEKSNNSNSNNANFVPIVAAEWRKRVIAARLQQEQEQQQLQQHTQQHRATS